ncbi:hypothetical protein G4G27_07020 [Sphingomonas sp. So64.6b]|uniref:hypothetical protein n=1 Tax=Sphingomonas sp. So64.6b TaxID=2997354 RepID=UPI0016034F53|nr:hypothetical protein [Sphingomonas sp. So64.6b]QNA83767.1 hypothetical protein G4G27_07020 [Sphingomonas sp. So64.6b]
MALIAYDRAPITRLSPSPICDDCVAKTLSLAIDLWWRKLIRALTKYVFEMMQRLPPGTRLLRDYLAPD